jgi:hypothetical protein
MMTKQLVSEAFNLWWKFSMERDTWDKDGKQWRKYAKLERMAELRYLRRYAKLAGLWKE